MEVENAKSSLTSNLHDGYPRSVWIGLYVGGITFLVQHLSITFLMFSLPWILWGLIVFYVLPTPVLVYLIYKARMGIKATEPSTPEPKGSWNVYWLIWGGFLVYQSWLWGVHSFFKLSLKLTPNCDPDGESVYDGDDDDTRAIWFPQNNQLSWQSQMCSWEEHKPEFYSHAALAPLVLMMGCFNFFKFSRGLVFDINYHRWVGRIHNVILLVCAIASMFLTSVTATPMWIAVAFYILAGIWIPSMLIGWYFIRVKKDINQHKRWMTRMFACSVGAITLRLYNLMYLGATPYWIMVWLTMCHLPVVEVYLQYTDSCDRDLFMEYFYGVPAPNHMDLDKSTEEIKNPAISALA